MNTVLSGTLCEARIDRALLLTRSDDLKSFACHMGMMSGHAPRVGLQEGRNGNQQQRRLDHRSKLDWHPRLALWDQSLRLLRPLC